MKATNNLFPILNVVGLAIVGLSIGRYVMMASEVKPSRGTLVSNLSKENVEVENASIGIKPTAETAAMPVTEPIEAIKEPRGDETKEQAAEENQKSVVAMAKPQEEPNAKVAPSERGYEDSPSKVQFARKGDQRWQLLRNGKPYFVKGVGGDKHLATAVHFGANSIRTWGIGKGTPDLLDRAYEHGMSVSLGYWMGHPRHGFNYHKPEVVKRQQDDLVAAVKKYKDHPALLFWGVGNEVETGHSGDDKPWQAINSAAKAIKEIDPYHPTMIVIAELGANNINVEQIRRHCPDIDVVGLNAYDSVYTIVGRYKNAKLDKPCIVTEYGPPLQPRDQFGLTKEPTSTEKAEIYRRIYQQGIARHPGFCFGGYSFVWGKKIEKTDTYFGQWLDSGERLAGAEVFHELFEGKPPANWCPNIESFNVTPLEHVAFAGQPITFSVVASDRDDDDLSYRFELKRELRATVGGDHISSNKNLFQAIKHSDPASNEATITPPALGAFRVYAYVFDGEGNAATATTTVTIKRKVELVKAKPLKLPYSLYSDRRPQQPYSPSGYMGDKSGQIKMNFDWKDRPHSGSSCLQIHAPAGAWSGVNWQHPAGDWGGRAGGFDFSGAKRLTFWARGANGGEEVTFALGGIGPSETYFDTAKSNLPVKLTKEWKQYEIDLDGKDLTRIKTPFHWSSYHGSKVVEFFVDDIRIEN